MKDIPGTTTCTHSQFHIMKWRTLAPSPAPKPHVQRQRIEAPTFPNSNRRTGEVARVTWRRQDREAERITTSTLGARPPGPGTGTDRARSLARLAAVRGGGTGSEKGGGDGWPNRTDRWGKKNAPRGAVGVADFCCVGCCCLVDEERREAPARRLLPSSRPRAPPLAGSPIALRLGWLRQLFVGARRRGGAHAQRK